MKSVNDKNLDSGFSPLNFAGSKKGLSAVGFAKNKSFEAFLVPSCVWMGHCVETHPDNKCMYMKSDKAVQQRRLILSKGRGSVPCGGACGC